MKKKVKMIFGYKIYDIYTNSFISHNRYPDLFNFIFGHRVENGKASIIIPVSKSKLILDEIEIDTEIEVNSYIMDNLNKFGIDDLIGIINEYNSQYQNNKIPNKNILYEGCELLIKINGNESLVNIHTTPKDTAFNYFKDKIMISCLLKNKYFSFEERKIELSVWIDNN